LTRWVPGLEDDDDQEEEDDDDLGEPDQTEATGPAENDLLKPDRPTSLDRCEDCGRNVYETTTHDGDEVCIPCWEAREGL
jgi:hypothetical protein